MKNIPSVALLSSMPKNQAVPHPEWVNLQADVAGQLEDSCDLRTGAFSDFAYIADGDASTIYHGKDGWDLADNDLVISRWEGTEAEQAISMAYYLKQKEVRYMNSYLLAPGIGKLACAFALTTQGVSMPRTFHATPDMTLDIFAEAPPMEYPFVYKDDAGSRGRNNYLIQSHADLARTVEETRHLGMIAQEFVPNDGDYRVMVLDGHADIAIRRAGRKGTHLNNISQGAVPEIMSIDALDPEVVKDCERAAAILKLDVAGVDVGIDSRTGKHYLWEVNRTPDLASDDPYLPEITASYGNMIKKTLGLL